MTNKVITITFLILSIFKYSFESKEEKVIDLDKEDIKINIQAFDSLPGVKISSKEELQTLLDKSDVTYLHYFYTKNSSNSYVSIPFIVSMYNKLEYLADVILTDCSEDSEIIADFELCKDSKDPKSFPKLKILSPPKFKINPYTKKKASYSEIPYSQSSISETLIYNFVSKNISSKGIKLNIDNHTQMIENPNLNKVLLFTDKPQSGLIFKGLSCYFYDRILFLEVHSSESILVNRYNIKKFPSLIVVQTLEEDKETEKDKSSIEVIEYTGNLKAKDIAKFIEKYALSEKLYLNQNNRKQSIDEFNKNKLIQTFFKKLSGNKLIETFDSKYKDKRIVIFLQINNEDMSEGLISFARKTNGFFNFVRINCLEDEFNIQICDKFNGFNKFSKQNKTYLLKETNLSLPQRIKNAVQIISFSYEDISSEINAEFTNDIIGLSKETFQAYTFKTLNNDLKVPVIYFFEKGDIDISISLMSLDENLSNYITFYAYASPSIEEIKQFGLQGLPNLIILGKDPLNKENAHILPYNQEIIYSKLYKLLESTYARNSDKDTVISSEAKKLIKVDNYSILEKECLNKRKACFISLLDGRNGLNTNNTDTFNNNIEMLESLVNSKYEKPFTYMYLNATCHDEILQQFNLGIDSLPNAIVYFPTKDLYSTLIGTFDQESINMFLDMSMKGKISMNTLTTPKDKMFNIKNKDCSLVKEEVLHENDDDDIMKEILEERKKQEEEEERIRKVKKDKKKKKKKNKKSDL